MATTVGGHHSRSAALSGRAASNMRMTTSLAGRELSSAQKLLEETRQAADDLVDETQTRPVVHLIVARTVGAACLDRQLM